MLESFDKNGALIGEDFGALEGVAGVAIDASALQRTGIWEGVFGSIMFFSGESNRTRALLLLSCFNFRFAAHGGPIDDPEELLDDLRQSSDELSDLESSIRSLLRAVLTETSLDDWWS